MRMWQVIWDVLNPRFLQQCRLTMLCLSMWWHTELFSDGLASWCKSRALIQTAYLLGFFVTRFGIGFSQLPSIIMADSCTVENCVLGDGRGLYTNALVTIGRSWQSTLPSGVQEKQTFCNGAVLIDNPYDVMFHFSDLTGSFVQVSIVQLPVQVIGHEGVTRATAKQRNKQYMYMYM